MLDEILIFNNDEIPAFNSPGFVGEFVMEISFNNRLNGRKLQYIRNCRNFKILNGSAVKNKMRQSTSLIYSLSFSHILYHAVRA